MCPMTFQWKKKLKLKRAEIKVKARGVLNAAVWRDI